MTTSAKIDITVKQDGQAIGHRPDSPVRRMPDGMAGVVVHGLVYAIRADHSVDLAREGIAKEDCPQFFRLGEDLVYAASGGADDWWFFEQTRRGAYLAFDGSETYAARLNEAFEAAGLSRGYRESFRPAKDGHFYDYFIRLQSHIEEQDVRRIIAEISHEEPADDEGHVWERTLILTAEGLGGPRQFLANMLEAANAKRDLEAEVARLRRFAQESDQSAKRAASDVAGERKERRLLASLVDDLKAHNRRLTKELRAVQEAIPHRNRSRDDLVPDKVDRLSKQLYATRKQLADAQEDLELSRLENDDLTRERDQARERANELKSELANSRAEERPTVPIRSDRGTTPKGEKRILNQLFSGAFPRLELGNKDVKTLLKEFQDLSGCAAVFRELQEGRNPPDTTKFKNGDGVQEVHKVKTGIPRKENMGRIYYRYIEGGNSISVAVQVKDDRVDQQRFVKTRFG